MSGSTEFPELSWTVIDTSEVHKELFHSCFHGDYVVSAVSPQHSAIYNVEIKNTSHSHFPCQ